MFNSDILELRRLVEEAGYTVQIWKDNELVELDEDDTLFSDDDLLSNCDCLEDESDQSIDNEYESDEDSYDENLYEEDDEEDSYVDINEDEE